jgi:hypothetical protein
MAGRSDPALCERRWRMGRVFMDLPWASTFPAEGKGITDRRRKAALVSGIDLPLAYQRVIRQSFARLPSVANHRNSLAR